MSLLPLVLAGLLLAAQPMWARTAHPREATHLRVVDADTGAGFFSAVMLPKLPIRAICRNANWPAIDLSTAWLPGINCAGAQLQWAHLIQTDFQGANFSRANLNSAWLWDADLRGANFWRASLESAALIGAKMDRVNLTEANLSQADMRYVTMRDGIVVGADLARVNLEKADLSGADLRNTILTNARMRGVNLTGANLYNTLFEGADLTGAIGLSVQQMAHARISATTRLPGYLKKLRLQSDESRN